jgi:hypothetical protein
MPDTPETPTPETSPADTNRWTVKRTVTWAAGIVGGSILVLFLVGLGLALFSDLDATAPRIQVIRDIFLIMIALEFVLIVGALAVVILQLARLITLLQTEVKPVLDNTQETVSSARGTVEFVGNNVAQPVIRLGAFLAGARVVVRELGGIRRAIRPSEKVNHDEPA